MKALPAKVESLPEALESGDFVPPTDDEADDAEMSELKPVNEIVTETPTRSSRVGTSTSSSSAKVHSRISELQATKSVLNYLVAQLPEKQDPIEPSDDGSLQYPRSSVEPIDPIQDDDTDALSPPSGSFPIQSTPALFKRMKDRNGSAASLKETPVLFPALKIPEGTPMRSAEQIQPHTPREMRPPPTPPWQSGEDIEASKKKSKKAKMIPSLPQRRGTKPSGLTPVLIKPLSAWTSLTQTQTQSPIALAESSMVDELRSSPGDDAAAQEVPLPAVKTQENQSSPMQSLFLAGTSQYPIPKSQLPSEDDADAEKAKSSSSESENEAKKKATGQLQRARSFSSGAGATFHYRGLRDIASQTSVFASPLVTPVITSFPPRPNGKPNPFGDNNEEEEEDSSSSDSDSDDADKSHIPKGRRAGSKRKKKKGLFSLV